MAVDLIRSARSSVKDEYEYESSDAANSVIIPVADRPEVLISVAVYDEDSIGGSIGDGQCDLTITVYSTKNDTGAILDTYSAISSQAIRILGSWYKVEIAWENADAMVHVNVACCGFMGAH